MTAAELFEVLSQHQSLLGGYQVLIVDEDAEEGEETASYPLTRMVTEVAEERLQLMVRFPDEKSRGKAYKNLDALLVEFGAEAQGHPDFEVTATIKIKVEDEISFHHLPVTGLGTDDEEKILWLLVEGLGDVEEETEGLFE